jgi:hypothetical protein
MMGLKEPTIDEWTLKGGSKEEVLNTISAVAWETKFFSSLSDCKHSEGRSMYS